MAKSKDDLEAVREVVASLDPFSNEERDRILRWACEKLGMEFPGSPGGGGAPGHVPPGTVPLTPPPALPPGGGGRDIRTFIDEKDPKNASQLAAVVAFYHQFVAPETERKETITSVDVVEACRQSERTRPSAPAQTLVNAFQQGLLNRREHGQYAINSVGENLVAMVLPDEDGQTGARRTGSRGPGGRKKAVKKKAVKKKAVKKKAGKKKAGKKKAGKKKAGGKRTGPKKKNQRKKVTRKSRR